MAIRKFIIKLLGGVVLEDLPHFLRNQIRIVQIEQKLNYYDSIIKEHYEKRNERKKEGDI